MNASPRTTREALLAEMLGDLDGMLTRIEKLPQLVENCEARLSAKADALQVSGDKYGQAVVAYTEQAKEELTDFLEKESMVTIEKHLAAIQKTFQDTLDAESGNIGSSQFADKRFLWMRLFEHTVIALLTSLLTVYLIRFIS